jgi:glycolate oxidase iron-sulfur subunit
MPRRLGAMLDLVPEGLPRSQPLPEMYPAEGERRARVALLAGCVQQVIAPEINWATIRVLAHNGVEVVIPRRQACCGALAAHTGEARQAKRMARKNLAAFRCDVDAVVTNAAGCGSGMHEYGPWLEGEPDQRRAEALGRRVKDVSVFLAGLGPRTPGALPRPLAVAYHDSCHLLHAQRVALPPRELLAMIPNLMVLEIPEGEICCGSAGTYNLEHPEIAKDLGRRKAAAILSTGADAVAAGNIGCLVQIRTHLRAAGKELPVYHAMQLLDAAYRGAAP